MPFNPISSRFSSGRPHLNSVTTPRIQLKGGGDNGDMRDERHHADDAVC